MALNELAEAQWRCFGFFAFPCASYFLVVCGSMPEIFDWCLLLLLLLASQLGNFDKMQAIKSVQLQVQPVQPVRVRAAGIARRLQLNLSEIFRDSTQAIASSLICICHAAAGI